MKVKVLQPLNYKGRTVGKGEVIELEDEATKTLIKVKAVEEVKDIVVPVVGVNTKVFIGDKQIGEAK